MTPKLFLKYGGILLITLGLLGLTGFLYKISTLAFFQPPYWINWIHFLLGVTILTISFAPYRKLHKWLILFPAIIATLIGVGGLLFGKYVAVKYNIPELNTDPSDHIAHLIVGFFAIWSWKNRAQSEA
jgi:hypothetical protein